MILLIIGFIFLIYGIFLFYKSNQIKINKQLQQQNYQTQLNKQIKQLQEQKNDLINQQIEKKNQITKTLIQWKQDREKEIEQYVEKEKQLAKQRVEREEELSRNATIQIANDYQSFRKTIQQKKIEIQNDINTLKASLAAGVQARLREQQINDKLDFYKLSINDADLADVKMLENLKISFHKPVVLSKLIWTQYFQKQMTQLCDRVLGKKEKCGIYKITNLITEQCYIGQSVNISNRWKQHCKCGLGIDSSSTNKLYNAMQKDGVWNFIFELLQECPKEELNEKEKFWIDMYQSNNFGYNLTKGNKT